MEVSKLHSREQVLRLQDARAPSLPSLSTLDPDMSQHWSLAFQFTCRDLRLMKNHRSWLVHLQISM